MKNIKGIINHTTEVKVEVPIRIQVRQEFEADYYYTGSTNGCIYFGKGNELVTASWVQIRPDGKLIITTEGSHRVEEDGEDLWIGGQE